MKINWCEVHLCGNLPNDETRGWEAVPGQSGKCLFAEEFGGQVTNCRMVQMQLVPIPTSAPYDIEIPDFVNRHGTVRSE